MRHILFIYNPRAGRRFNTELLKDIEIFFSADSIKIIEIQQLEQESEIDKFDTLVAIGGDGTVNTVAEYCSRYNSTLAIIPRGSGDGLARHLKLKRSTPDCLKRIKQNKTTTIDSAYLNHHYFVNVAGTGFEAEVAHTFHNSSNRGLIGYIRSITSIYTSYPEQNAEIRLDGKWVNIRYFSLSFANGSQWGNDFEIASKAKLEDGKLEVVVMRKPKWFEFPSIIKQLKEKKQLNSNLLTYYNAKNVEIDVPPIRWHKDGEAIELDNEVRIEAQPLSLRVNIDHE